MVDRLVKKHQSDKATKGINTWTHMVAMIFMQMGDMQSLRDISNGLRSATGNLSHLGINRVPCKSSISYLNKHRSYEVFKDLYFELLNKYSTEIKQPRLHAKRVSRKVYIMDSSVIPLSLSLFDWASFRSKKGGIKLHTVLDYDTGLPNYAVISEAKEHDVKAARAHHFLSGSVVVVDRAYVDFEWLNVLDTSGVKFVTRLKSNASYNTVNTYLEQDKPENILLDSCIKLTGQKTKKSYPKRLRIVKVYDQENDQELTLLTNDFTWKAETVGELYRARWDVEVFFKHLKQLFRVKSFVGTSGNAVRIQMWCSMISMLLIKYLKAKAQFKWHLSNLIVFLRLNLFVKIDLYQWINNPIKVMVKQTPIRTLFDTS
jgi:hypothetical protein